MLGPVRERLQGVRLPLTMCSVVELAGTVQAVTGLASFRGVIESSSIGWAVGQTDQNLTGIRK